MTQTNQVILVTGPARSGKSEWAEQLAHNSGQSVIYVATAQENAEDPEWQARIDQHRSRRPPEWRTVSVPVALAAMLRSTGQKECLLVDSLGTWLANLLDQDEETWAATLEDLLVSLKAAQGDVILVAEETGWGVVPAYPIGRTFRDRLGKLIREVGAIANCAYLVAGGYVLNLSVLGMPLNSMLSIQKEES